MKTLSQILIIASFCICTCYLQSCVGLIGGNGTKCPETEIINRNITAGDLSKVPYTGFDTLYFLSKTGDTCVVRGTGKQFGTEEEAPPGDPACPPERKYINQLYTINFVALKGNLAFTLTQKRNPERIYIDKLSYGVTFDFSSSAIGYNYYLDSIQVLGIMYNKVTVFLPVIKTTDESFDTTYQLLYNKPFGVIRIKSTKHNEEYSLIPKP